MARIHTTGHRPDLVSVTLGSGRRLLLQADEVAGIGLAPGTVVDAALEERLGALDERTRAREAALRLLRYRPRSRAELASRLRRRGTSPPLADAVVEEFTRKGLLDDARFARGWAEHRALSLAGPLRVRAELRARGVSTDLIEEAIHAAYGAGEADLAATVIDRHLRRLGGVPADVRLRRLAGLLRRRGFSGSVIGPLLRRALDARRVAGQGAAE